MKTLFYFIPLILHVESHGLQCKATLDLEQCSSVESVHDKTQLCEDIFVCQKVYRISIIRMEPYDVLLIKFLIHMCCGECTRVLELSKLDHVTEMTSSVINNSHFVFPVYGNPNAVRLHGHYFIPFIEPPSFYYVTRRSNAAILHFLLSCIHLWPIVVICLLMAAIAGFFCWIMETWNNRDEFPRSFVSGWFAGWWWSVIAMTTVGYGRKIPKSVPARFFSVLWILVGITTFSVITAMLASEIYKASYPPSPSLSGVKVGALRHRMYDALVIGNHGGILVDVKTTNQIDGIFKMTSLLRSKEIDGFMLDRHTFTTFYHSLEEDKSLEKQYKDLITFLRAETVQSDIKYDGDKMTLGMVVNEYEDYLYFADYIKDNKDIINVCLSLHINNLTSHEELKVKTHQEDILFAIYDDLFWPTLITITVALSLIVCFGIVYELAWKSLKRDEKIYACVMQRYRKDSDAVMHTQRVKNGDESVFYLLGRKYSLANIENLKSSYI